MFLRESLPVISVPLRKTDAEVRLDLQTLVDQCYRNGGYERLNYEREPDPPLDPDDAKWADALLREKGFRKGKARGRSGRNGKRRKAD